MVGHFFILATLQIAETGAHGAGDRGAAGVGGAQQPVAASGAGLVSTSTAGAANNPAGSASLAARSTSFQGTLEGACPMRRLSQVRKTDWNATHRAHFRTDFVYEAAPNVLHGVSCSTQRDPYITCT